MADIWSRLSDGESNIVERKQSAASTDEIRRTIVAFANSVPVGDEAVLFIGVKDDGTIVGCQGTDSNQKKIEDYCRTVAYPPINIRTDVREINDCSVLAIIVPHSTDRPHFSGPAYVRAGSQSKVANEEQFRELIAARTQVGAELLRHKGQTITVVEKNKRLGDPKSLGRPYYATSSCRIVEVTLYLARFEILASNRYVSEPLGNITVNRDEEQRRLMVIVQEH